MKETLPHKMFAEVSKHATLIIKMEQVAGGHKSHAWNNSFSADGSEVDTTIQCSLYCK